VIVKRHWGTIDSFRHKLTLATILMPWKCPACQTQIAHDGDMPELHRVYRCHVCRLELVLEASTHKLTVAPLPTEHHNRRATERKP